MSLFDVIFPAAFALLALYPIALQSDSKSLLDQGYYDMYNLQFQDAHNKIQQWEQQHPEDALGPASNAAAYLFSEFHRLHIVRAAFFMSDAAYENGKQEKPDPEIKAKFDADLNKALQLANAALKKNPKDTDALFAKALRFDLKADYDALIVKQDSAALGSLKSATGVAKQLLKVDPNFYDAHFALGVESYLLSLRSAPVRWFLSLTGASADRAKGVKNLKLIAEKGHYLQPYAQVLLAVADIRANHKDEARQLLTDLAGHFPGNTFYRDELKKIS